LPQALRAVDKIGTESIQLGYGGISNFIIEDTSFIASYKKFL
jgi:hypothetical protein